MSTIFFPSKSAFEVRVWKTSYILTAQYNWCDYLSYPMFNQSLSSKRGPWYHFMVCTYCMFSPTQPCNPIPKSCRWWWALIWDWLCLVWYTMYYTTGIIISPAQQSCCEVCCFHSVSPSIRPSRIPCPLCSAYNSRWIHFIFKYLIEQLQKVCRV